MENIDPKLLRAFLHVAREGSISAAARRLGLSRAAVSLRVRTLEKRLGARLFHRAPRGLSLAPSGSGLLPAAREIVAMNDRLFERATALSLRVSAEPGCRSPRAAASATPDPTP